MQMLRDTHTHSGIWSSLVLLAKEHCLSVVVGGVICSASGVDGWSLDIFIPRPVSSTWMKKGLRNGGGAQEGKLYMVASDQFPILPCPLNAKRGAK